MRTAALGLAALLVTGTGSVAQADDAELCSTAQLAAIDTLAKVAEACTRALAGRAADPATLMRYRGTALARGGNSAAARDDFNQALLVDAGDTEPAPALQAAISVAAGPTPLVPRTQSAPTPQTVAEAPQPAAQQAQRPTTRAVTAVTGDGLICGSALSAPQSELAEVIRACGRIQGKQPTAIDRARVLRYRGLALQRSGDAAAAVADFDQALALTPEDLWALQGRAESHEALGQIPQALADYGRLAVLRPGDTRWRIKMAQLGGTAPAPPPPAAPQPPETQTAETAPPAVQPPETVAEAPPAPEAAETEAERAAEDPAATVRRLQAALRELGYDVGAVTGRVGGKTREAMDQFAGDVGLPPGGEPDATMLAAAEEELRHRREQAAREQRELNVRAQKALVDLDYDIGDIDGVIGSRTRNALRAWSSIRGQPTTEITEEVVAALEQAVVERLVTPAVAAVEPAPQAPPPDPPVVAAPYEPPETAQELAVPPQVVEVPAAPDDATPPDDAPAPAAVRSAAGYDIVAPATEAPEKRVALVIGNANYHAVTPLVNPKHDAADVSAALSELGFEVFRGIDLSRDGMSRITRDFARKARDADIAMAYYSGHGIQFERTNYLVPVDGQIKDEYDLREMVELDQVIRDTTQAKKVGMVVVDACRDDPLATKSLAKSLGASRSSSLGSGLAAPKLPPSQSLIAYATAADFVAYDGDATGRNSPFTAALLRNIKTPKLDVRQLFGKVSDEVRKATGNEQRPDMWAALGGDPIYLVPGPPEPVGLEMADLTIGEVLVVQRSLKALKFWSGAEDGTATPDLTLAVRRWQQSLFTEQTGRLTPQQLIALNRTASRDRPRYALPEFKLNEAVSKAFRGEVEAQRLMGMVYDPAFADAAGFDKDRPTARNFYEMAANQGDVHAASLLGAMLVAPDNPQPDRDAGMRWLEQASKGGDTVAALRMAELVVEREPNTTGYRKAVPFLKIAATDPNTSGMANAWLRHVGQTVTQ